VSDRSNHIPAFIIGIFVLAVILRVYGVLAHPTVPTSDAGDYHRLATGLAQGNGYLNTEGTATAWRPPAYPVFLAIIYKVFGITYVRATIVQAVLGGFTVLLLIYVSAAILGWREAIVAGLIAAVYPGLIWLPRLLLSENLSLFVLLLSLGAIILYLRTVRLVWMIAFGVLCALNTLVRGANLSVPVTVALGLIFISWRTQRLNSKPLLVPLLVLTAALGVTLVPWTARNYHVFHRWVPVATQDGIALYASYWPPRANGKLIWGTLPGPEDPVIVAAAQAGDEVAASKYLQQVTLQRLREEPLLFFRLIPSKVISLLVPLDWEIFPHAPGTTRSINVGYLLILLPALLGFVVMVRQRVQYQWLLWIIPATLLLQAVVFYGSPRFRLPAELIAMIPAAAGVSTIGAFFKQRLKR
jgi:4-amino-4-deoxy-L-arabinose transferase-like glycosyltransferase